MWPCIRIGGPSLIPRVMCIFANVPPQTEMVDLVNAAYGFEWTIADMMKCGERGWNIKRAINNRLGLTARQR